MPDHARHIDHVPGQDSRRQANPEQDWVRAQCQAAQRIRRQDCELPRPPAAGLNRDDGPEQDRGLGQGHVQELGHELYHGQ